MEGVLLAIYGLAACGGALAVVLSQNVVRMAFWLVISLSSVAGLFFLLNADFVGATQLLIYVGGTVVLLIFGVMLTSSGPYRQIPGSSAETAQAALIGISFLALISSTVLAVNWQQNEAKLSLHEHENAVALEHGHNHGVFEKQQRGYNPDAEGNTSRSLGAALLGVRFDKDLHQEVSHEHDHEHSHSHGPVDVSTGYLLPFEVVSVHLLVVLVAAAYLAHAKRRFENDAAQAS